MITRAYIVLMALAVVTLVGAACSGDEGESAPSTPGAVNTSAPVSTSGGAVTTPESATPVTASAPAPEFSGYAFDLSEGDFWEYRWSWVDGSCVQFRCSSDEDDGVFQVTLGSQREIEGVALYELDVTGKAAVSLTGENRDFAPRWDYLGVDGDQIVVSNGSTLTTLFDAGTGKWAGSGYFTTRFNSDELVTAQTGSLSGGMEIADWTGVTQGSWEFVGRSDSQSACEIIAGERICPNEDTFSFTENEFYRPGIGPVAYQFQNTVTFDGFADTFSTTEWVALVGSSLRGDNAAPTPTPDPTATPLPSPPNVGHFMPVFGPVDGSLNLDPGSNEIPDFSSGVSVQTGVVEVEFTNPDISGGRWSFGVTFRQAAEETFHAVYFTGSGEWGHFVRSGTFSSSTNLQTGTVPNDRTPGGTNFLTLAFDQTEGQLFLNDDFVATLDLSAPGVLEPGDVRVMSGLLGTDLLDGSQSVYSGFIVLPLP